MDNGFRIEVWLFRQDSCSSVDSVVHSNFAAHFYATALNPPLRDWLTTSLSQFFHAIAPLIIIEDP
jgi:hypothetical protein